MIHKPNVLCTALALVLLLFVGQRCASKGDIIVTDDVLMLTRVASGLEPEACADFASSRSFNLPAIGTETVNWSEAKSLTNDTLKIIRLEILSDTGSVAQFTMTLRPLSNQASEIQCMKGFGCTSPWVHFPWIAPGQNFLDQTVFKFRVRPAGIDKFTIENYNASKALMVRVNPPI